MKKTLIIIGILLILILGAAFAYVLLYGTPTSVNEIFARFTDAPEKPPGNQNEPDTVIDTGAGEEEGEGSPVRLYQLTTRPVAGATFIDGGVRYMERGTGHIYEIDIQGGEERIISGTTIHRTIRAIFSPGGDHVAIVAENEEGLITILGTMTGEGDEGGGLNITTLPDHAREAGFSVLGDTLNFFVPENAGGSAYAYTISTGDTTKLFSIPLTDVRILWGAIPYVYTTPSAYAYGYVYRIGKGGLEYVTEGGKGLMAFHHGSSTIVSSITEAGHKTRDVRFGPVPVLTLIPEKCTAQNRSSRIIFCANPNKFEPTRVYPDDWYKGVARFSDSILKVDSASTTVTILSDLERESGRPLDVSTIYSSSLGDLLLFINKYDGTLWMLNLR